MKSNSKTKEVDLSHKVPSFNKPFLLDEEKLSRWALNYCYEVIDDPEIRSLITDSYWAYLYCKYVNDDPEVRKYITDNENISKYFDHRNREDQGKISIINTMLQSR